MTVASGSGRIIGLKGLDTFVGRLPCFQRSVYNHGPLAGRRSAIRPPENVLLCGYVSSEELVTLYQGLGSTVALFGESFGMALAEAMACGCVPVVTERGAMPEVVGDTGYYVPFGNVQSAAEAIEKALSSKKGLEARMRVEEKFSLNRREKGLSSLLESVSIG